jgi:hypothetical protein
MVFEYFVILLFSNVTFFEQMIIAFLWNQPVVRRSQRYTVE